MGPPNAPYAQRLDLGWIIVGDVCLGTVHKPSEVNVYKANVLNNGRVSFFRPCPKSIHMKEDYEGRAQHHNTTLPACEVNTSLHVSTDNLRCSLFDRSKDDNKLALSIGDRAFQAIMDAK